MSTLREDFGDKFSGSAFVQIDNEPRLIGKYGQLSKLPNGDYDAWFVGKNQGRSPGDYAPLSGRRLAAIRRACASEEGHFMMGTGEAWIQGDASREFALRMASLLGIKRKRHLSPDVRAASSARLAKVSATRAPST